MHFMTAPKLRRLEQIERNYMHTARLTIVVQTEKRPHRELVGNEHWALDVEAVGNRHIGRWRVTGEPGDIGSRPQYPFPVLYFYFIDQEPNPSPDTISNT